MRPLLLTLAPLLAILAVQADRFARADVPRKPDPYAAVGHLRFGPVGKAACGSGTVIGPRREDGRWNVLTALHCLKAAQGVLTLRNGTALVVHEAARHAGGDLAWMVTEATDQTDLPFALLAEGDPKPGTRIWHAGWGIDRPGVRKYGTVLGGPEPLAGVGVMADHLTLRVSTAIGDSGGGYFDEAGRLVAVCSKTTQEEEASVCYAGAGSVARRIRP